MGQESGYTSPPRVNFFFSILKSQNFGQLKIQYDKDKITFCCPQLTAGTVQTHTRFSDFIGGEAWLQ